ncbi:MAG: hypothetical protein KW802_00785 [Candidatus Doudnabacteria bacterium]|nr:hypothetical protein [Candidatus Doudnabacteria bacterium]
MQNQFLQQWSNHIQNMDEVVEQLELQTVIAVGVTPYPRIIPSLFLDKQHFQIYCVHDSADIAVLRNYAQVACMEQVDPKVAQKVHSTEYLMRNYVFQSFLKSQRYPYSLLLHTTTPPIIKYVKEQNIPWIGNDPKIFEPLLHKKGFKELLVNLRIEYLPDWVMSKEEFYGKRFTELQKKWNKAVVAQPGDYEVSGSTYFIHNEDDLSKAFEFYNNPERFERVQKIKLTPFVTGNAVSMLGCVMDSGILTSPLQLQLIDVPEALHDQPPTGAFFGHDWGYKSWSEQTAKDAQTAVEQIGRWLSKRGYRGIFGVDFIHDQESDKVYPLECNPRFTGAIPAYSEINILNGVAPIDFMSLVAQLRIPIKFDFNAMNELWKKPTNAAHIAIVPNGVEQMKVPLNAGVYTYHEQERSLEYLRPGAFLHELKNDQEFLIIDQVPKVGKVISQNVPRLFKFIFNTSIAEASNRIKPLQGQILNSMAKLLRR